VSVAQIPTPSSLLWRIYYDGGYTYSNLDGPVEDAPGYGVLVIQYVDQATGVGRMRGFDFYVWDGEEWFGHDLWGLLERLFNRKQTPMVAAFAGRSVSEIDFQTVWKVARHDKEFPEKSGKNRRETPKVREMNAED
jgi:hypothetical protein